MPLTGSWVDKAPTSNGKPPNYAKARNGAAASPPTPGSLIIVIIYVNTWQVAIAPPLAHLRHYIYVLCIYIYSYIYKRTAVLAAGVASEVLFPLRWSDRKA